MGTIKLFKAAEREFKQVPVATGALNVARIVEDPLSHDLGAGVVEFEDISIPWTLDHNGVFYALEGELRFRTEDGAALGGPGNRPRVNSPWAPHSRGCRGWRSRARSGPRSMARAADCSRARRFPWIAGPARSGRRCRRR